MEPSKRGSSAGKRSFAFHPITIGMLKFKAISWIILAASLAPFPMQNTGFFAPSIR